MMNKIQFPIIRNVSIISTQKYYDVRKTRSSSQDETANVNFFTMTSCTYYKIQNLLSNEAEIYKNFIMVKSDLLLNLKIIISKMLVCITHSFLVNSVNIAINNISLKTRFFGLHFCCRKCWCTFNHFYVMHLKATKFGEIMHGNGLHAVIMPFLVIQGHRHIRLPITD